VIVSTSGGTSTPSAANQFTYVPVGPAPTVTKLSAKTGPAAGGTSVTISGSAFTPGSEVRFGSATASTVTVVSSKSITTVSPPGTTGAVNVSVVTPNGASAAGSKSRFRYGSPTVAQVSPDKGPQAGGTDVTLTGSGFAPGKLTTIVKFGIRHAASVECSSSTTCVVVAPAQAKGGAVDVRATVDGKTSHKNRPGDEFTYGTDAHRHSRAHRR